MPQKNKRETRKTITWTKVLNDAEKELHLDETRVSQLKESIAKIKGRIEAREDAPWGSRIRL